MGTVDIVFFAIRAAVHLGKEGRAAIVDATREASLDVPLPDHVETGTVQGALDLLRGRKAVNDPLSQEALDLLARFDAGTDTPRDEARVLQLRKDYLRELAGGADDDNAADAYAEGTSALVTIGRWENDPDAAPGVLQRFGGTLVDLGVEWLSNDPGALDGNSRKGRAVRAVLHMLDGIDLEKTPPPDLPGRLLTATLDSLAADPRLMTDDPAMAQLITVTGRAVSEAAGDLVKQSRALPGTSAYREADVTDWAEAVFRAAIGSGGRLMLEEPARFLGVAAPKHQALVTEVGATLLEVSGLLGNGTPTTGRVGLQRVARAALDVVADHPELLLSGDAKRLRPFLSAAAGHLAEQPKLADLGAVPGVLAVLVDRARAAPELLWPAAADSDGKELALSVALETVDRMLPGDQPDGAWRPSFNALDIEDMVGFALDEIVDDPGWLIDRGRALSPRFGQALDVTFSVLREKADRRLGRDTGLAIVKRVLRTVYLRPALMDMRDGSRPALADVLDAVVGRVFSETADVATANRLLRKEVIELVTGATLEAVADVAEDLGVRLPDDLEAKVEKALDAAAERVAKQGLPTLEELRDLVRGAIEDGGIDL